MEVYQAFGYKFSERQFVKIMLSVDEWDRRKKNNYTKLEQTKATQDYSNLSFESINLLSKMSWKSVTCQVRKLTVVKENLREYVTAGIIPCTRLYTPFIMLCR